MLKFVADLDLSEEERLAGLFSRKLAICLDTGAYLSESRGRARGGTNYTLILPDVFERSDLWRHQPWTHRSQFKAWTRCEAIEIANRRLPGLVRRQQKRREG